MEITFDGGKVVTAHSHGHLIRTDQPVDNGGSDTAPAPFDLFLASIGTCAGIYVKSFCDNRKIPAENIKIIQTTEWNKETGLPTSLSLILNFLRIFRKNIRLLLFMLQALQGERSQSPILRYLKLSLPILKR